MSRRNSGTSFNLPVIKRNVVNKTNLTERPSLAEDAWKDTLKDICEVARNSLHNLVSSGTPPLPRYYHQEFVRTSDILQKPEILKMVLSHGDQQALRFRKVILKARDRISEARTILVEFEEEAKQHMAQLDQRIDVMNLHLIPMPEGQKRDLKRDVRAIQDSSRSFVGNISGVVEQIGKQENLLKSLARQVHEDPLTGVLNRRAWERDLDEIASADAPRSRDPHGLITLVIADIDRFKNVNDSYGHPVGDAVLKQFAALLGDHFAGSGSVYRYGGDEFGIIFPGFSVHEAAKKLEGFRKRLQRTIFIAINGKVKRDQDQNIRISASYGVAGWTGKEDIKDVVSRADHMLYRAKKAGRDRIKFNLT